MKTRPFTRTPKLIIVFVILTIFCARTDAQSEDKFDSTKLPGTNIKMQDIEKLTKFFKLLKGGYDGERERIWWLVETKTDIDAYFQFQLRLYDSDGAQLTNDPSGHFTWATQRDVKYTSTLSFLIPNEKRKGERFYFFRKHVPKGTIEKVKEAKVLEP